MHFFFFFFQAEDGIRDAQESRGLGDVYKRQIEKNYFNGKMGIIKSLSDEEILVHFPEEKKTIEVEPYICLLYTSDAADDLLCVDLGGRRIIKKKKNIKKAC